MFDVFIARAIVLLRSHRQSTVLTFDSEGKMRDREKEKETADMHLTCKCLRSCMYVACARCGGAKECVCGVGGT